MSSPVSCRLELVDLHKLQRIKTSKGLKNNSEAIKYLVQNYENDDKEIKQIKKLVERLEKKIDNLEENISMAKSTDQGSAPSSQNDELIKIILRIVLRLAESNPRACAALRDELPELFEK